MNLLYVLDLTYFFYINIHTSEAILSSVFWSRAIVFLILETKPHQDILREKKIKIVPIAEVKGVQGNWKHVMLYFILLTVCLVRDFFLNLEKWWHGSHKSLCCFSSGTKNPHICDKGDRSGSAASSCTAEDGATGSYSDAGLLNADNWIKE